MNPIAQSSSLHWVDLSLIAIFILYALYSGLKSRKLASKNLEEYFLAGRSLSGFQAGLSMAATQFAADTPLLVTGLIATAGLFSLWRLWVYAIAFLLLGFLLSQSWRRAKVLTDAELTEIRYGEGPALVLRGVKAFYFGTVFNCTVLAMVLLAATRLAGPFLQWHLWLPDSVFNFLHELVQSAGIKLAVIGNHEASTLMTTNSLLSILAVVSVTTLYSTTGGLRSVVATDVFQLMIMLVATGIYAGVVIFRVGGLDGLYEKLNDIYLSQGAPQGMSLKNLLAVTPTEAYQVGFPVMLVLGLQWLIQMNSDGTGYLAQRTMACKTDRDAKVSAIVFTFTQVFLRSLLWIPVALGLLVLFPPETPGTDISWVAAREATFIQGMTQLLPIGAKGLMLTGMLAALASTVDTHLNWGASYWTNDLYRRIFCEHFRKKTPHGKGLVWVARISNLLILLLALLIMANLSSIKTAWEVSLLLGASMGIPLLLRWFWWRMNVWGEIAAILTSLIFSPLLLITMRDSSEAIRILMIAGLSLGATLLAIYLKGPEDMNLLKVFYLKTKPPGFWGPVALQAGMDPSVSRRRFFLGFATVMICAFSLFSLLVGSCSLLFGSPTPVWFPAPKYWSLTNFIVGFGLIPLWWGLSTKERHTLSSVCQGQLSK